MTTLAEALAPKSDLLNADDLISGPRTITITDARITKTDRQTRIRINFEGDNGKPWYPCKTMGRAMVMAWAVTDEKQMIGKSVRLYRDPTVKFGDQGEVGGIRISHMSHIEKPVTVKLTVTQGKKGQFVFQPLPAVVQDDRAAKWTADFLAKIEADPSVGPTLAKQHELRLAELREKRPELAAQIDAALSPDHPATAALSPGVDDSPNSGADVAAAPNGEEI